MDATDPRPQLLGAILRRPAKIAHAGDAAPAEAFGCFTVGDIWTFVRAEAVVRAAGTVPRLAMTLSWSREFTERRGQRDLAGALLDHSAGGGVIPGLS